MIYKIKTLDGYVVRKKATRPYVTGLIARNDKNEVISYHSFSIDPGKHKNYVSDSNYKVEKLIFEELK